MTVTELSIDLPDPAATDRLGAAIGHALRMGDVVALHGDLGAGKSALSRAAIRARLGDLEAEVPSPTFTLIQTYETYDLEIWHVDLYRLDSSADAFELGLDEAFAMAACLIEWPERLGGDLPADALRIDIAHNGDGRRATVRIPKSWRDRTRIFNL
ncbi:tRNA (adenosine(37)-N6)-threonylcarbamoyltransferase complex ATPase subunit type 1 TsaE [Pacificispira spongiicola]|uniref:tRNA (adenosine(37)-N6)-threonylcarbamoyltransferase complex ATPase subunit type 1 TsaE n=1 Tax=Pacificispira spongiicola TaxID=2729598 RepID=UPI001D0CADCF|nr:tRNA (adenosine(37)-N6)-threonylcarbamoyltransferase complex ATPase subunit type 1 TsaE [Pacificispira spongiicola]